MKRVCVFCGSRAGRDDQFRQTARELGQCLARAELGLVYGGGSVGLMGIIADAVVEAEGQVIGVIPRMMDSREIAHPGVQDMRLVDTMHERKALMADLSDAFIAMPGGYGTLEELFEVISWAQLGIHDKPIGLLNAGGFYDALLQFIDHAIDLEFIKAKYRDLLVVANTPDALLAALQTHQMPPRTVWAKLDQV